ncbi:MAG: DUF3575 domain-containing protein [Saprospiraceae bacterium]|nr:DUF3575 domain-containing protein [Saprospiraceae bacterium]MBP7679960.1 DUF3575 domain-containing protein [Saprospiraceae bacterium]
MKNLIYLVVFATIIGASTKVVAQEESLPNKKHIVKLNVLSPFLGCTEVGYEYMLKTNRSVEVNLGIIGLGQNKRVDLFQSEKTIKRDASGVYGAIGYKMNLSRRSRSQSPAGGFFLKPTLTFGTYSHNRGVAQVIGVGTLFGVPTIYYGGTSTEKEKVNYYTAELKFGYQFVISHKVLVGLDLGIGYGSDNKKKAFSTVEDAKVGDVHYTESFTNFSSVKAQSGGGLTGSAGINVGIAF